MEKINNNYSNIVQLLKIAGIGIISYLILRQLRFIVRGYPKLQEQEQDQSAKKVTQSLVKDTEASLYNSVRAMQKNSKDEKFSKFFETFFKLIKEEHNIYPTIKLDEAKKISASLIAKTHETSFSRSEREKFIYVLDGKFINLIYCHYVNGYTPVKVPSHTRIISKVKSFLGIETKKYPEHIKTVIGHLLYYSPELIQNLTATDEGKTTINYLKKYVEAVLYKNKYNISEIYEFLLS